MSFINDFDVEQYKEVYGEDIYIKKMAENYLNNTDYVMIKTVERMLEINSFADMVNFFKDVSTEYTNIILKRKEARMYLNDNIK